MEPQNLRKKALSLLGAAVIGLMSLGCSKVRARMEIREANNLYGKEQYADALKHYEAARRIDPSLPDLDRLIGYSAIGLFKPDNPSPENAKYADRAIQELQRYLRKRPRDETAREALINLLLNADRTSQAIAYFENYLKENPADLNAVKSVAQLYARQGDFAQSLNWYHKITLLDARNPESHYIYGVVLYEKVAKNPPEEPAEVLKLIEEGKQALGRANELRPDYFEALVYLNLLYRHQAKYESDPMVQQELLKTAEEIRNKAMAISRARKQAG